MGRPSGRDGLSKPRGSCQWPPVHIKSDGSIEFPFRTVNRLLPKLKSYRDTQSRSDGLPVSSRSESRAGLEDRQIGCPQTLLSTPGSAAARRAAGSRPAAPAANVPTLLCAGYSCNDVAPDLPCDGDALLVPAVSGVPTATDRCAIRPRFRLPGGSDRLPPSPQQS